MGEPMYIWEYDNENYDPLNLCTRKYHVIIAESHRGNGAKDDIIRLVYDENGDLTEMPNSNVNAVQHYRYALSVCTAHDELRHHVPMLIRWLHDHDPEEVLRL